VLRGIFIFAGVSLIERFDWILYIFGAFLLYTAVKIARHDESKQVDYNQNLAMRAVRKLVPTTGPLRRPEPLHQGERQAAGDARSSRCSC
jgi:tellurite resistance protein TerC